MNELKRLKELFVADGELGVLVVKEDFNSYKKGDVISAGIAKSRYKLIRINGRILSLHRIIWMLLNGPIIDGLVIDHINGNTRDNRICNLRACSQEENLRNRKTHSNNQCGLKGVYFDGSRVRPSQWRAQIRHQGRKIYLGRFPTKEQAHSAYIRAAKKLHGEFSRDI
ncbi:HNH endonuclease [Xenorhabdus sp. BG5]|uniref:HNH endonuclease n=1 Tax=Xenorhabdus sp. BG5 TaxID=2782014 RepID=UPI00187DDAEA|nr:HNH endonuclease [Xenorhabdus sp. BG5]MBE8596836.1 HNH endonuclease [Xenorhabdus sp. BG5]